MLENIEFVYCVAELHFRKYEVSSFISLCFVMVQKWLIKPSVQGRKLGRKKRLGKCHNFLINHHRRINLVSI